MIVVENEKNDEIRYKYFSFLYYKTVVIKCVYID